MHTGYSGRRPLLRSGLIVVTVVAHLCYVILTSAFLNAVYCNCVKIITGSEREGGRGANFREGGW